MKSIEVMKDIYWTGVRDWNLTNFHGHSTPKHSTYNSYVILDEKITIIDGAKLQLSDEMIERVESITSFDKVSYIVVNHVEMDHSGNMPILKKLAPQAKIITCIAGKMALEEHYDTTGWEFIIIKMGEEVSIGKRTLSFFPTPMLHWPDSMVTYIKEDKILFSNDAFGQHLCDEKLFVKDVSLEVALEEAKRYYANILLPFNVQTEKAVDVLRGVDIDIIAPGHGCVFSGKEEVSKIMDTYDEWASGVDKGYAVVVYDTMWGATSTLADAVKSAFESMNIPVRKMCLQNIHYSDVMIDIMDAKYVAVGTPTLNNEIYPSVVEFLTYLKGLAPRNKVGFAFNSYGWKKGVASKVEEYFDALGWDKISSFDIKYSPKIEGELGIKEHLKENISK